MSTPAGSTHGDEQSQDDGPTVDSYLESTEELGFCLDNPTYDRGRPVSHIRALAFARLDHLKSAAEPFGHPNDHSKKAVDSKQVLIPGTRGFDKDGKVIADTGVWLKNLTETDVTMALLFSTKLNIDEVEAVLLWRRYRQSGADGSGVGLAGGSMNGRGRNRKGTQPQTTADVISQIFAFYMSEVLAVCNLLALIIRQSCIPDETEADDLGDEARRGQELQQLCVELRDKITHNDSGKFIGTLFNQFEMMAKRPAPLTEGRGIAVMWALHNLRVQVAILDCIYLYIYYSPDFLSATTAKTLIFVALLSSFGTEQANARLLERNPTPDGPYLLSKIEALMGVIAIESLGLALLLDRPEELGIPSTFEDHNSIEEEDRRLCQSAEAIAQIHAFLSNASASAANTRVFPLLLLGWSYVLKSIPTFMVPGNHGGAAPPSEMDAEGRATMYERPASVACHPQQRLLSKWQELLAGPLLCASPSPADIDKNAALYKDSMNVLLRAFSAAVSISKLPDQQGVEAVWCLLYGQGDAGSVRSLCTDFWDSIEADPARAEVLAHSWYPYHPEGLPALLRALDGNGTMLLKNSSDGNGENAAAVKAYKYLDSLSWIVTTTQEYYDNAAGVLEIPGMTQMSCSQPQLLSQQGVSPYTHRWHLQGSGWGLTLSMLAAAVDQDADLIGKWRELGVEIGDAFVEIAIVLIDSLSGADSSILDQLLPHELQDERSLIDIVISTMNSISRNLSAVYNPRIFASSLAILGRLVHTRIGRVLSWLAETRFFGPRGVAAQICALEQRSASYLGTRAILDMVHSLVTVVGSDQYGDSAGWNKEKAFITHSALSWQHEFIWTRFTAWQFADPLERSRILQVAAATYAATLVQSSLLEPNSPLQAAYGIIVDKFVVTASPFDVHPIFYVLEGGDASMRMAGPGRLVAIRAGDEAMRSVLDLVDVILSSSRGSAIPLVHALLERIPVEGDDFPLDKLIRTASSAQSDTRTALVAANSLAKICRSICEAAGNQRGIAACLSNPTAAMQQIHAVLADPLADTKLVTALWNALAAAVSCTPSLAYVCAGVQDKKRVTVADSIVEQATCEIGAFDHLWWGAPDRLSAAVTFVKSVFAGRDDLLRLSVPSDHESFWQSLNSIAQRQSLPQDAHRDQAEPNIPLHRQHACRLLARATAVDLLRYGLEIASEEEEMPSNEDPSVQVQCGLDLASQVESLRSLVYDAGQTDDDRDRVEHALERLHDRHPSAPINDILQRWRLIAGSSVVSNFDAWLEPVTAILNPASNDAEDLELLRVISDSWTLADANDRLGVAVAEFIAGLADFAHLQAEGSDAIAAAASRCSLEYVADLPLRQFKGHAADHRLSRTITICADLLELGSTHIAPTTPDWGPALSHLVESLPLMPLGSQLSHDAVVDRSIRTGLHLVILYVLSSQPAVGEESDDDAQGRMRGEFLEALAPAGCQSLFYTVEKGMGGESEDVLADLTMLASIISLAWQKRDWRQQSAWLSAFDNHGIISHLLNLLIRGFSTADRPAGENIYAPVLLRILASIAQLPGGAVRLVSSGIVRALDMTLTIRSTETGRLRPETPGQSYAAWTSMLDLLVRAISSLPNARGWMDDLLPFLNKSAPQFRYSCTWDLDSDDCLLRLTETKSTLCIMRQVVGHLDRAQLEQDVAFLDPEQLLSLLSAVTAALSSQRTLKVILESETSGADLAHGTAQQDLCLINNSLLAIGSDIIQVLSALTKAPMIVCGDLESWRAVTRLALPVRINKTSSIRILTNFLVSLADAEELDVPDSANISGSPVTQDFAPLAEDTRKTLVEATADRAWLVCVAQAVMITQISAAERERIRVAKAEGRDEKVDGKRQELRLDSIDLKALSSMSSRSTKSLMWRACCAFLREHVDVN